MDRHDVASRKFYAGVYRGDCRIVPLGDFTEEDACQSLLREVEFPGHSRDVVDRNISAEHGREMENIRPTLRGELLNLIVGHGTVRRAKIDGSLGHLFDARAGAERLVVDLNLGEQLVVFVEPL